MKVRITFLEEVLGTASSDQEIHDTFIGSNAPDAPSRAEEIEALGVEEVIKKDKTIFPKDKNGTPIFWDYQIKGFFKDACSMLQRVGGKDEKGKKKPVNESTKITAYKKVIDGLVFVFPRAIPIIFDGEIGSCQRPLRGQTAQGERIALANSETVPAGAYIDIEIECLNDEHMGAVVEWLDYGKLRGIGQWRNSGKGRFEWKCLDELK